MRLPYICTACTHTWFAAKKPNRCPYCKERKAANLNHHLYRDSK